VTPSPLNNDVQIGLQSFLVSILPPGVEVVEGQDNRVPEPAAPDYVVMTAIRKPRLATNVDAYADCAFTAAIAGTVMTVSAMRLGAIAVGSTLFGVNVAAGTIIRSAGTGSGGVGTYNLSASQTVASEEMACGEETITKNAEWVFQLEVHGPNSSDNVETISTLFRDGVAVAYFADNGYAAAPLYADEPRQLPFLNAEQQYEYRWVLEARLQVKPTVTVPLQFAEAATVGLINVEATYPP